MSFLQVKFIVPTYSILYHPARPACAPATGGQGRGSFFETHTSSILRRCVAPRRNGDGLSSSSHTQEEWKKWSTTFASSLPLNPPHCEIYYSVTIENAQKLTSTKDFVGSKDNFFLDQDPGSRFIRDQGTDHKYQSMVFCSTCFINRRTHNTNRPSNVFW